MLDRQSRSLPFDHAWTVVEAQLLRFGEFVMDPRRFELRRHGNLCALEPKVFDLIAHLAEHPDRVFKRDELVAAIWKGRVVSDATISTCVKSARRALGDSGRSQHYIRTVRGRGFRFAAKVVRDAEADGRAAYRETPPGRRADAANDPSLLVLPFRAVSDVRGTRELAAGLTGEIPALLTRIPLLRLSALSASAGAVDVAPGLRQLHETHGIDFVLDASVQRVDGSHHINVGLCDARTGFRLWSERFTVKGSLGDALQAGVRAIAAKLEPQIYRAVGHLVSTRNDETDGRVWFLRASSMLALKGWHHDSFATAAGMLRRSWQCAPELALAPSYLALVLAFGSYLGLLDRNARTQREARRAADPRRIRHRRRASCCACARQAAGSASPTGRRRASSASCSR